MKILLADDHELVRETLSAFLEKENGFKVSQAGDLAQAKRAMETHDPFDLILLDYDMLGMNGQGNRMNKLAGDK